MDMDRTILRPGFGNAIVTIHMLMSPQRTWVPGSVPRGDGSDTRIRREVFRMFLNRKKTIRFFSILTVLALVISVIPAAAFADTVIE